MAKTLSKAEAYVKAVRDCHAMYAMLSAEEREEAAVGIKWMETVGEVYVGAKMRGRPPGSRNRSAVVKESPSLLHDTKPAE